MNDNYDVIAIGSGHNGLVAAAYVAAAGKKTLVLERNSWFGGGVVTRELTVPGFRHDQHSMAHIFIQANPLLKNDELGLKARHGLRYLYPDPPMMSVFEDGTSLGLYRDRERTCADIAKFSKKDADAYRWLADKAAGYLPMVCASLYAPPAPLGATYALMDQSREGRELWRYMQMSSHDLLCSVFEHDKVRMHFARVAGENLVSPDEKATGFGAFVFVGFLEAYGFGVAEGGSGRLTDALIASIREHGGDVVGDSDVARVIVRNGRAAGVETTDGRTFTANDAVIGALHPHDIGRMVDGVEPEVVRAADATQISEIGCITIHAALNAPLRFRAGEHVRAVMIELLPNRYDTIRKSFDKLRYGELSDYPMVGVGSLTMFDRSRAPEGKATMHAWDYVPYERADGRHWDDAKDEYVERMLTHMSRFVDNVGPDDVIAYHSDSPVDMERTSSSFRRGDLHGIASTTYQYGAH
ncbi:MAG: NAD(P)/FAD-dependent oxidoreductase, partial [Gammaproteobacteria bacterium]|nr:NAD(P)/FAD-dependent oxidoreductase [Gammaproteobacteria bacterium]